MQHQFQPYASSRKNLMRILPFIGSLHEQTRFLRDKRMLTPPVENLEGLAASNALIEVAPSSETAVRK